VVVGDPTEPLEGSTCKSVHEHVALNDIRSSSDDHLSIERREMAFRVLYPREKDNLGCDIVRWNDLIHDRL